MGGGGEPGHVDADLGDDHLGGPFTDPRDRAQQPQLLGERGEDLLDPVIQPVDHAREVVDLVRVHPGQQGVMVTEPSSQAMVRSGILFRIIPRASSASTRGSRSPPISASIMSRADKVVMLEATESILMPPSSKT